MVTAIVKQRDMYRTLLAQSTPLPPEMGVQQSPRSKVTPSKGEEVFTDLVRSTTPVDSTSSSEALKVREREGGREGGRP